MNKVSTDIGRKIKHIAILLMVTIHISLFSYGQNLVIIEKYKTYKQQVQADSLQKMIEIRSAIPEVRYKLVYATAQNFTGVKLYGNNRLSFARLAVVAALKKVQQSLAGKGYAIQIFDAYRPYDVTKKMWALIHDERYVADPAKGSGHNRGLSLDLTLFDLKTGLEVNMGTGFDNFTDSAHQDFKNLPTEILANRLLLKTTMEQAGFVPLSTEWWHYSWPNNRNYAVLNLDVTSLKKKL